MAQSVIDANKEPTVGADAARIFATAYANARECGLDCEFLWWYNAGIRHGLSLDDAVKEASQELDLMGGV